MDGDGEYCLLLPSLSSLSSLPSLLQSVLGLLQTETGLSEQEVSLLSSLVPPQLLEPAHGEPSSSWKAVNRVLQREGVKTDVKDEVKEEAEEQTQETVCGDLAVKASDLWDEELEEDSDLNNGHMESWSSASENYSEDGEQYYPKKDKISKKKAKREEKHGCQFCTKTFTNLGSLNRHGEKIHSEKWQKVMKNEQGKVFGKSEKCPYCLRQFAKKAWLSSHIELSHKDIEIPWSSNLIESAQTVPSKGKSESNGLQNNKDEKDNEVHEKAIKETRMASLDRGDGKDGFFCDQCGKTYGTKASLYTHSYIHRAAETVANEDGVNSQEQVTFSGGNADDLKTFLHSMMEQRNGAWTCIVCGKSKEGKSGKEVIRKHVEGVHGVGITYKCNKCDKVYRSRNCLYVHNSVKHSTGVDKRIKRS